MNCLKVRRQLSAYLDGELTPPRAERVARHLAGCAECAAQAGELRTAYGLLGALEAPDPGASFTAHVLARVRARRPHCSRAAATACAWPRWATAAALVACLLIGGWLGARPALRPSALPRPVAVAAAAEQLGLAALEGRTPPPVGESYLHLTAWSPEEGR